MASGRVKGGVRRSQLITTYGVGAVVALGDESFMVAGIDRWPVDLSRMMFHEPRLERQLGVQGFVQPPASDGGNDVPIVRFPIVYFCSECHRLERHGFFTSFNDNKCNTCGVPLIPSRFVVVCENGHIDDFPYFEWVHKEKGSSPSEKQQHMMKIEAGGASASLSDIVVSCSCGKSSTMYGAFSRDALKGVKRCTGRRPWLGDNVECDKTPRTLQRGASNVYFAVVRSALSIPPWSEGAFKVINQYWRVLEHIPDVALRPTIEGMGIAAGTFYSVDDLVLAVRQRRSGQTTPPTANYDETMLRLQEYEALMRGKAEVSRTQDFVCVPASGTSVEVEQWFERVMMVTKLREVRALQAFTRLLPPESADPPERRAALTKETMDWLPAVEVLGEGVFLHIQDDRLSAWETRPEVVARVQQIQTHYLARCASYGTSPIRTVTPRFVLIHTLAHVLINQWSLDAGYPAASLRERLYVSDEMAGLLIYTATTDSAGSLGGIVAQSELSRLQASLREAIANASWCSADPLCIEADAAGTDALNLAACHACVLLPEVSCEEANVFLDRALLVGTPEDTSLGFFVELLER
jgi:hypothetical protein